MHSTFGFFNNFLCLLLNKSAVFAMFEEVVFCDNTDLFLTFF